MKKLLSLVLVFVMLVGMLPAFASGADGITITYDPALLEYGVNIADISYDLTKSFYSYHSRKEGWSPAHGDFRINGDPGKGMMAHHYTAGDWYAIELNVPVAGEYDVSIECIKRTYGSNKAYIYILDPEESKDIEANLTEENKFAEKSFNDTENYKNSETATGKINFETAGKYLLVVQGTEKWTHTIIGKIVLSSGNGTAIMGSVMSVENKNLHIGETTNAAVSLYYSDGGSALLYPDEKSYESSDISVATVDSLGVITAVGEGTAEITATVDWKGTEYKSTTRITVVSKSSDVKIVYDFIDNYTPDVPYKNSENNFFAPHKAINEVDTYGKTYDFWKFASAVSGIYVNHMYSESNVRKNGLHTYFKAGVDWFAINVRVPVADTYNAVLGYDVDKAYETDLGVYILEGLVDYDGITDNIAKGAGFVGSVNCTSGKQDGTQKATLGSVSLSAGEHTVVFCAPNTKPIRVRDFALSAGTGEKKAIMSADMSLAGKKLSVSGVLSDEQMSAADMSGARVMYEGKSPDVAEVSPDGTVKVIKAGELKVLAKITYGEQEITLEKTFAVEPQIALAPSGAYEHYDLLARSDAWDAPMFTQEPKRVEDIRAITYEYTDGKWQWHSTDKKNFNEPYSDVAWIYKGEPWGRFRLALGVGEFVAFSIKVPAPGRYFASIERNDYNVNAGAADIYIIPQTDDVKSALLEYESVGNVDCYNPDVLDWTAKHQDLGIVEFPTEGEYLFAVKKTRGHGGEYINLKSFTLDGNNVFKYVQFDIEDEALYVDEKTTSTVSAFKLDGTEIDKSELDIRYTSSDTDIATVSRDGTITALRDGKVTITATIRHETETHSASQAVEILDASGVEEAYLTAPSDIYVTDRKQISFNLKMKSGIVKKISPENVRFEIVDMTPENAAVIDSKGYVSANKEGTITVSASTWYDDARHTAKEITINLLPSTKKNRTTIYTQKMRETALENSKKYTWAKDEVKAAKELADRYVNSYEALYGNIAGKGLPTSRQIGGYGDPDTTYCRYCGKDLLGTKGRAFTWDIISRPWKIQCPDCKRIFPSNEFENFYNLGLDEYGLFDVNRALEKHQTIFGGTYGTGYLENNLYPELAETNQDPSPRNDNRYIDGKTWGVDDGWGYIPRDKDGNSYKYENGVEERHPYIAYYVYSAWESRRDILEALKTAYVYTGEEKYGRAGAILLDRIADIWPAMDSSEYTGTDAGFYITDGGNFKGKTQGCIDDCVMATLFAECTDAFFPIIGDSQVINFLSEEAEKHSLENKKESAYDIWSNWETGIIEAAYDGVKKTQIGGNFGQLHFVVTTAAVALDSQPKTNEMLDFVFKTGVETDTELTGGSLSSTLVDIISRDGMGNEAGPQYNYIWLERIFSIADLLGRYTDDEKYNIWNNTKFVQMFMSYPPIAITSNESVQVGDSGGFGTGAFRALPEDYIPAFKYLKKTKNAKRLANYIYLISGEESEGLHYDIMTENPESLESEVESLLDSDLAWFSEILTGYGFGMLRSGEKFDTVQNADYKRGVYMNFGRSAASHGHMDALNIGITAYDLNMTPDLGYPSDTGTQPQRLQWVSTTLSHNTVLVNEKPQLGIEQGFPQHFDDSGKVKLLDVDASGAYAETDIYRRTLVTVDIDEKDSYIVDFFRIMGGDDHLFSFHVAGDTVSETSLTLGEEQPGSYADPNWPYGEDPNSPAEWFYDTVYPRGYTWLKETRRAEGKVREYDIDFEIKDYKKRIKDSRDLHLRLTMLNDFELDEVALTTGHPPTTTPNLAVNEKGIKYLLARRTGTELDSLFTTVYEPYKKDRKLSGMEKVSVSIIDGTPKDTDAVKAVKVTHSSGRVDYVIYATNNSVTYQITDGNTKINFRGFVGVYSVQNGVNVYSYLNDGDILGTHTATAAITGEVVDFSRDLSLDNYITVKADGAVDAQSLAGKVIVVDNDMVKNGAYYIESAKTLENGDIKLDIGTVTAIRKYKDANDFDAGFVYNINPGQNFKIATSFVEDSAPIFDAVSENLTTSAGSALTVTLSAKSDVSDDITYEATSVPRGASVDEATGKVTWKPDASQIGENLFIITAVDEFGRNNSISFVVTVYGSTTSKPSTDDSSDSAGDNDSDAPSTGTTDNSGTSGEGTSSGGGGGGGGGGAAPSDEKDNDENFTNNVEEGVPVLPPDEVEKDDVPQFTDLGNHVWAADAISSLAADGIIKGTTASTFSPAANITRADFALLLVRAFKLESDNTENFADVSASDYFAPELAIARNNGIISGIGDNRYAPRNTITRQDMMVIVYRALSSLHLEEKVSAELTDEVLSQYHDFTSVAPYARDAVSALISVGLVNGKSGLIAPLDYTTRAEVAVLIKRILDYIK